MLNWSLLQNLLIIAIACSSITVILIQKTKKFCRSSNCVTIYSLLVNLILGFFFSQTFSNISYINSIWVGLFSFLGADTIYRNLEGKLAPYSKLVVNKKETIDIGGTSEDKKDTTTEETVNDDVIGEITYE